MIIIVLTEGKEISVDLESFEEKFSWDEFERWGIKLEDSF